MSVSEESIIEENVVEINERMERMFLKLVNGERMKNDRKRVLKLKKRKKAQEMNEGLKLKNSMSFI